MSDDAAEPKQDEPPRRTFADRWWWLEGLYWCFELIWWIVFGVVRLAAWIVAGILSSCS